MNVFDTSSSYLQLYTKLHAGLQSPFDSRCLHSLALPFGLLPNSPSGALLLVLLITHFKLNIIYSDCWFQTRLHRWSRWRWENISAFWRCLDEMLLFGCRNNKESGRHWNTTSSCRCIIGGSNGGCRPTGTPSLHCQLASSPTPNQNTRIFLHLIPLRVEYLAFLVPENSLPC
jgi:hypothetical protein